MTGHGHLRAVGVRIDYDAVPVRVRDWVDQVLGAPVVGAVTQRGGMSPGCAVRVRLADGRRAFVKAVGLELNADTAGLHRHEAMVLAALPDVSWRPPPAGRRRRRRLGSAGPRGRRGRPPGLA